MFGAYLNNSHVVISHYLYICNAQYVVTVHTFLNIRTYFISLRHDHLSAAYNPSGPSKPLTTYSKSDIYLPITKLIHIHFWLNQPPSSTMPNNTVERHWCHFSPISSSHVLKICKVIYDIMQSNIKINFYLFISKYNLTTLYCMSHTFTICSHCMM